MNKELDLSPGEESIFEYISNNVIQRLLGITRQQVTHQALKLAKELEFKKLEEYENQIQLHISANFPFVAIAQRYSALFNVFNDVNCWMDGLATADPCNPHHIQNVQETEHGWSATLSYKNFEDGLNISLNTVKSCLERLIQKGKLEKKRGIQGYRYRLNDLSTVIRNLETNQEPWFSVEYDHQNDKIDITYDYDKILEVVLQKYDIQSLFQEYLKTLILRMKNHQQNQGTQEIFAKLR